MGATVEHRRGRVYRANSHQYLLGRPLNEAVLRPVPSLELDAQRSTGRYTAAMGHQWAQNEGRTTAEWRQGRTFQAGT